MPKLRPMPKFQPVDNVLPGQCGEPVKVIQSGKGSK